MLFASCSAGHRAATAQSTVAAAQPTRVLRIAADPNNLPFTNDRLEGFENKLAELVARELNARVEYTWRAQRRGFFRETLKGEQPADLILAVPAHFERALTTSPYYRSSYAFVTRKDRNLHIESLDDPALKQLKVGVQLIGEDGFNTPPAHALARRGIVDNVVGFTVYGDYAQANPPARIVDAVAKGDVDVGIVWGPLAGYFAQREGVPLEVTPVTPVFDPPALPLAFDIAMGVRKNDRALRDEVERVLRRRRDEVQHILDAYGVPRVEAPDLPVSAVGDDDDDGGPRKAADSARKTTSTDDDDDDAKLETLQCCGSR
jgi:quinoprotein dehydrogenase-associated probable ABC transporter substrate-binding protein